MGTDLLLGFLLANLFGKKEAARRPAEVILPTPGAPPPGPLPPIGPSSPGAVPPFPTNVDVPPSPPPPPTPAAPGVPQAGFKKAVEVWVISPGIREAGTVIVGAGAASTPQSMRALEANFPRGWQGAKSATAAETAQAVALLKQWRKGGVVFAGPDTFAGRRAFRMTEHPQTSTPAAPQSPRPAAPIAPAAPTVPASITTPAAPSSPPPFVPNLPLSDERPQRPATGPGAREITTVRRGEGLSNVAARLGQPATGASAVALRAENVPAGPDNVTWESKALSGAEGGIKKKNRKGGLQPGDRLFVPLAWGPIDPARL